MTGDAVTRRRKNMAEILLAIAKSDGLISRHVRYIVSLSLYLSIYLYIKEYRTVLSTRQSLVGSSRDFTREQGRSRT